MRAKFTAACNASRARRTHLRVATPSRATNAPRDDANLDVRCRSPCAVATGDRQLGHAPRTLELEGRSACQTKIVAVSIARIEPRADDTVVRTEEPLPSQPSGAREGARKGAARDRQVARGIAGSASGGRLARGTTVAHDCSEADDPIYFVGGDDCTADCAPLPSALILDLLAQP